LRNQIWNWKKLEGLGLIGSGKWASVGITHINVYRKLLALEARAASSSVKISPSLVAFNVSRGKLSSSAYGDWLCMKGHLSFFLFLLLPLFSLPSSDFALFYQKFKVILSFCFYLDWVLFLFISFFGSFFF